jgi:cytochrome b subunit of formate dehydrogenase
LVGVLSIVGTGGGVSAGGIATSDCLQCHGQENLTGVDSTGTPVSVYVDGAVLSGSIHGDFDCIDCHDTVVPHPDHLPPVECGSCHDDAADAYVNHGGIQEGPGHYLPDCHDCHGTHDILPASDARSRVAPNKLLRTCGHCHSDPAIVGKYGIPMLAPVETFASSVHAQTPQGTTAPNATCVDCHSSTGTGHQILPPTDPDATIFHFNISNTCARCHVQIGRDYAENSHGRAVARGESDAPVCTACHGEHAILPVQDPRSPVYSTNVSLTVCGPCHASEMLHRKYGLRVGVMESWKHSYHGLKSTDGDTAVATCASCHLEHKVLPKSDPRSSVNPANLHRTCGRCHRGVSAAVVHLPIHTTEGIALDRTGVVLQGVYVAAIIVIIGLMVVHWLVELQKYLRLLNQEQQIVRMRRDELWQHTLLMVSFIVLTVTGFAFHYSGAWWVRLLFGWPGGFALRHTLHRVAAIVFMATALWHLIYLCGFRGRQFLHDMLPRTIDFRQFGQMIRYNLGRNRKRPRFGRFSYVEKAEYWALAWGTVVMSLTGVGLWFGNATEATLGIQALGVMLVVHFWEAVLAGLAILVWHLYSTIFNPPVYPNNPSWYTGKMPARMYRHEHPEDPVLKEFEREEASRD